MDEGGAEAVSLFEAELRLCGVRPGERVAILAPEGEAEHARATGFLAAARRLEAEPVIVTLPGSRVTLSELGSSPLSGRRDVIELLKTADLLIDLMLLLFSREQLEIQAAGVRVLLCVEPLPVLARLLPDARLRDRVERAAERLSAASELRVVSDAGTDVVYHLGPYPTLAQYGHTDEAGRWDHWPSGFVATHAEDTGVDGRIVIQAGDVLCLPRMRYVEQPVELIIEGGYVTDVRGDGLDAVLVRDYLPDPSVDREAWAVSHVGWGLCREAGWAGGDLPGVFGMEQRSVNGSVMISTGPNTELGGTRETPFHLDVPQRGCSLFLDGEPVVERGTVVADRAG